MGAVLSRFTCARHHHKGVTMMVFVIGIAAAVGFFLMVLFAQLLMAATLAQWAAVTNSSELFHPIVDTLTVLVLALNSFGFVTYVVGRMPICRTMRLWCVETCDAAADNSDSDDDIGGDGNGGAGKSKGVGESSATAKGSTPARARASAGGGGDDSGQHSFVNVLYGGSGSGSGGSGSEPVPVRRRGRSQWRRQASGCQRWLSCCLLSCGCGPGACASCRRRRRRRRTRERSETVELPGRQ